MPATQLRFYHENGQSPVYDWLTQLRRSDLKAFKTILGRMAMLIEFGHELRRPVAAYLRDGIYELRTKHGHVQYRVLYFFHERDMAVLAHAIVKKGAVDEIEIERAVKRKTKYLQNPQLHGLVKEVPHA